MHGESSKALTLRPDGKRCCYSGMLPLVALHSESAEAMKPRPDGDRHFCETAGALDLLGHAALGSLWMEMHGGDST